MRREGRCFTELYNKLNNLTVSCMMFDHFSTSCMKGLIEASYLHFEKFL